MTLTATCGDCNKCWRGPHSHDLGGEHERETDHIVWYDQDNSTEEEVDTEDTWTDKK